MPPSVLPEGVALTSPGAALLRNCLQIRWFSLGCTWSSAIWVKCCRFLSVSRPGSLESSRNASSDSSPLNLKGRSPCASVHFAVELDLWLWARMVFIT